MPLEIEYAVVDPRNGETVKRFPTATREDIETAVDAAHRAFTSWARSSTVDERARLVRRVARLHEERRDELAAIINREMGKSVDEALGEVDYCIAIYDYYADNAANFLQDEKIELRGGDGSALVTSEPLGVLLGIMPWNFPAYQVARFAGPNLAAGNTVLLKHAPQCPESSAALEAIFRAAGFPDGAYVNIYATNDQVAELIADRRVQGVSLTGSERAGSAVAEIAGRNLKKVVLELGGADPFIVLSTDDLEATVDAAVAARLSNTGQACNAGKRVIVHDQVYDEFLTSFTRKMLSSIVSPLSSVAAAERLEQQVTDIVQLDGVLETAGVREGAWYPPGVLTGLAPGSDASYQELFGPVAMVFRVRDEQEAIAVANDTPYGLGAYIFTTDRDQAERVAKCIDAGMVFINGVGAVGAELPFGGVKRSGFGRELGRHGISEFVNKKLIRTVR